jgi:hypothetical protein
MSSALNDFQTITCYQDLNPYLGQIVAVEGSYYFNSDEAFSVSGSSTAFAHVSNQSINLFAGGEGYHLNILYKIDGIRSATIANAFTLKKGVLSVRKATTEELKLIKNAVASSSAAFSDLFCREAPEETDRILEHI